MNPFALILPCFALLILAVALYRGAVLWWDMLTGLLAASSLPWGSRLMGWAIVVGFATSLVGVIILMNWAISLLL